MGSHPTGATRRQFIVTTGLTGLGLCLGLRPSEGRAMSTPTAKRAVVLGIDGMDVRICRELMAQGRLPNLARLAEGGTFSPLATVNPPQSPVAWSGIASGANPGVHGIYDFIIRNPRDYLPDLSLVKLKRSKFGFGGGEYVDPKSGQAFWDVAAQAGLPATVVRWPVTFPAKGSKARMLSGLGAPDVRGSLGRYVFYAEQAKEDPDMRGELIGVSFNGQAAETEVRGPMTASFGRRSFATVKLNLTRQADRLVLKTESQELTLAQGQWSDWLHFNFSVGLRGHVKGIARFFLTSLNPLGLYLTPVQIDPDEPCFPLAEPEGYAAELAKVVGGPYATLGMPEETKGLSEEKIPDEAFLQMCQDISAEREKMFDYELGRLKEGLLAFVFDTSDRIQHMFWRLRDPRHPLFDAQLAAKLGPVIDDHYGVMDQVIGRTMKALDDKTALFICSDHGFEPYTRSVNLNTWLAEAGYLKLKKHDPDNHGELFEHVDWSGTKAYALGFGSIYLNLAGREKDGQVKPGQEAQATAEELAKRLAKLKDQASGRPVVHQVHRKADIYSGPLAEQAPELVVGYNPPYRVSWTTAIGGSGPKVFEDNTQKWSGDHCIDASFVPGVLFSNLKLDLAGKTPKQTQLAATVLKLLGIKPDKEMEPGLV